MEEINHQPGRSDTISQKPILSTAHSDHTHDGLPSESLRRNTRISLFSSHLPKYPAFITTSRRSTEIYLSPPVDLQEGQSGQRDKITLKAQDRVATREGILKRKYNFIHIGSDLDHRDKFLNSLNSGLNFTETYSYAEMFKKSLLLIEDTETYSYAEMFKKSLLLIEDTETYSYAEMFKKSLLLIEEALNSVAKATSALAGEFLKEAEKHVIKANLATDKDKGSTHGWNYGGKKKLHVVAQMPVSQCETKDLEKIPSYEGGQVLQESEIGSPAVQLVDIWEFGDMINGKLKEVAADNPDSTPSDIIEEALGQVIQQDIEDDELCCLDINDGERRSVTIRWKSNEVCCIDGDALMLLPGPQTGGVDSFKFLLDQKLNQTRNSSSDSSTWPSEDDSDFINNLKAEAKPPHKVQQGAPKKKSCRYPKYRILLKGKPWSESEEEHAHKNNPRKRSRIVGQKRQKLCQCKLQSLHIVSPTSDVNACPLCAVTNVNGHQRSDVESLTDCVSGSP